MRRSVYFPDAAREERIEVPVLCGLIRHAQGNVLFDTGCSPQAAIDPEARWGRLVKVMEPVFAPDEAVVHQLYLAGLEAEDIDLVICSHLHADHCGCNSAFPGATVLCHAAELAAARSPEGEALGYLPADWDHPQNFQTIADELDLFGDGRITLLPVPGHTVGMLIAHVVLDSSGPFVLASDAVPMRAHLEQLYAPRNSWDMDLAVASTARVARMAEEGATVIFGHDAEQLACLRTGRDFYF